MSLGPPPWRPREFSVSHLGAPRKKTRKKIERTIPDADSYTPGSLRSGCASIAAERHVHQSTIIRHLRWSTGMQGVYTDTPAEDILAVSRAVHQAYQRAPSSSTDWELYTTYDDECHVCNQPGLLILCDGPHCRRTAHAACAGLDGRPDGEWLCVACRRRPPSTNLPQSKSP